MDPDPLIEQTSQHFDGLRESFVETTEQFLSDQQAALLAGILLGVKDELSPEFKKALINTSTIHIAVVSGQNLTLIAGFLMNLAPFLGRKKMISLILVVTGGYAVLTGLGIPVIRAMLMFSFSSIALLMGREKDSLFILVLTGLLMLTYQPNWLLSLSFQLSFMATVAVVVMAPILIKAVTFLPEVIKQDLLISLAAQLLTAPIIAANFHQLSHFGILANSLILWTVTPIMVLGAGLLAMAPFGLGEIISFPLQILLTYFIDVVEIVNRLPNNTSWIGFLSPTVWLGYYLLIAGIVWLLHKHQVSESANSDIMD